MQSRTHSLIEAVINTLTGYLISLLVWQVVKAIYSLETAFIQDIGITCIFTVTSIIRNYLIRRVFNGRYNL